MSNQNGSELNVSKKHKEIHVEIVYYLHGSDGGGKAAGSISGATKTGLALTTKLGLSKKLNNLTE